MRQGLAGSERRFLQAKSLQELHQSGTSKEFLRNWEGSWQFAVGSWPIANGTKPIRVQYNGVPSLCEF
jgi:hypothetical protein